MLLLSAKYACHYIIIRLLAMPFCKISHKIWTKSMQNPIIHKKAQKPTKSNTKPKYVSSDNLSLYKPLPQTKPNYTKTNASNPYQNLAIFVPFGILAMQCANSKFLSNFYAGLKLLLLRQNSCKKHC